MAAVGAGTSAIGVQLRLLGGFAVIADGEPVDDRWRLRKAKTLVKLLALAPGHRLHRDAIVDELWPGQEPSAATNNLHQALHAARRALGGPHVVLRDDVVVIEDITVDIDEFEEAATKARSSDDIEDLRTATSAWTGPLLPEDTYAEWSAAHRDRLNETYAAVVAQLGTSLIQAGAADEAVSTVELLAQERALDEPLQRTYINALASAGRRFDAIAAYEQLRDALDAEYAAEPQQETKAIYRQLLGSTAPSADAPHNLPLPATSFVGRQRALGELTSLIQRARLLTLSGPGGSGKTRLSIELARRRLSSGDCPDGAWFIDLSAVQDPDLVPSSVATALRIPLSSRDGPLAALTAQLAGQQLLLVLDNCEHVLAACADLATELLANCPHLVVLTTSREPLGLPGEVIFRVPSLELPDPTDVAVDRLGDLEAVQLFVERAREVSPDFRIDETTASAVARICYRLDGIPLALELAAARLAHLTASQLAERLSDALRLLASHGRGRLDRQQTLAATLDWSHELLDEQERVVFRRLAIFAGGFDLEAAECVCDVPDVVNVLGRLVDKSLVHADTSGERARYRLHEVVRQYAEVRLASTGDLADCRRRHFEWYAEQATRYDPERGDPVVQEPSQWFDIEQDNIRVALAAALSEEPKVAMQLATSTWRFWLSRGLIADGARWIGQVLDACDEVSAMRARALFAHGVLQVRQGLHEPLPDIGERIVEVARQLDDEQVLLQARHQLAVFRFMAADWSGAADEIDALSAAAHDNPAQLASLDNLAAIHALTTGDIDGARERWDAALDALTRVADDTPPFFTAMFIAWAIDERGPIPMAYGEETMLFGRRVGAAQARAHVLVGRAMTERLYGNLDEAVRILDGVADAFERIGDRLGLAHARSQRGHTRLWAGDYDAARADLSASEQLRRQLRDHRGIALSLAGRGILEAHAGNESEARRLAAEAVAMMRATGDEPGATMSMQDAAVIELVLGNYAEAARAFAPLLRTTHIPGGHRSVGWTQLMQAHVLAQLGDEAGSTAAAGEAFDTFTELGERRGLAAVLRACKEARLRLPADRNS